MVDTMHRCWTMGVTVVTLSLLWSLGMPAVTGADEPGAVCVLKITPTRENEQSFKVRLCGQLTKEYVPEVERMLA